MADDVIRGLMVPGVENRPSGRKNLRKLVQKEDMMEKIKARGVHRFAFSSYGGVALLVLALALVGAAAGHAFGAAQPATAAPATAPVLAQAEPGQSTATDISDDARMTGTYQPGMQGLRQPATAISVNAAQMTGTYLPGMQGLQLPLRRPAMPQARMINDK